MSCSYALAMSLETKVSCGHRIDGQPQMGTRFASAPVSDGGVLFEYGPQAVRRAFPEEGMQEDKSRR